MSEPIEKGEIADLAELFIRSFPDMHCLPCGGGDVYILPSARQAFVMG